MSVDYDHSIGGHTVQGALAALKTITENIKPQITSMLDVGCGEGTWIKAALELGIKDVQGIDGVTISPKKLLFDQQCFACMNLEKPFDLGRRFDAVFCLEVAEHLEEQAAEGLIQSLVKHSDTVVFAAGIPRQFGQHHVNCQWPSFWQAHFNRYGYVCDESIRWILWDDTRIEPWYRQNLFIAHYDKALAGTEKRIKSVIHPDMNDFMIAAQQRELDTGTVWMMINNGSIEPWWCFKVLIKAGIQKILG